MKNLILTILGLLLSTFTLSGCTDIFQKPLKSGLQIVTEGSSASVFINGQYLDKTPLVKKDFKPGEYYLEIKPDDDQLAPYETSINLRGGFYTVLIWQFGITPQQSGGVTYEMEQIADATKTEVEFNSIPDGAILEIQGKENAFTPIVFDQQSPGTLEYKLSLPSYETQEHTIDLVLGYRSIVTAKLAKLPQTGETTAPIITPAPSLTVDSSLAPKFDQPSATESANDKNYQYITVKPTKLFIDGREVLRARSAPSVTADQVGLVEVGKKYQIIAQPQDGWIKIQLEDGGAAFVSAAYAKLE